MVQDSEDLKSYRVKIPIHSCPLNIQRTPQVYQYYQIAHILLRRLCVYMNKCYLSFLCFFYTNGGIFYTSVLILPFPLLYQMILYR